MSSSSQESVKLEGKKAPTKRKRRAGTTAFGKRRKMRGGVAKKESGENEQKPKVAKSEAGSAERKAPSPKELGFTETGLVYFFYRPRVSTPEVSDWKDVSRFYLLMSPFPPEQQEAGAAQSPAAAKKEETPPPEEKKTATRAKKGKGKNAAKKGEEDVPSKAEAATAEKMQTPENEQKREPVKRPLLLSKKQMPNIKPGKRERFWSFVSMVSPSMNEINEELGMKKYETKTRGEREIEPVRPVGEGVYAFLKHGGHTHFIYVLLAPEVIGEAQHAFNIAKEGSFIVTLKNPNVDPKRGRLTKAEEEHRLGLPEGARAEFPPEMQEKFKAKFVGQYKFVDVDPPDLLNFTHAEVVWVPASKDVEEELGEAGRRLKELTFQHWKEAHTESKPGEQTLKELGMSAKEHPIQPIARGELK